MERNCRSRPSRQNGRASYPKRSSSTSCDLVRRRRRQEGISGTRNPGRARRPIRYGPATGRQWRLDGLDLLVRPTSRPVVAFARRPSPVGGRALELWEHQLDIGAQVLVNQRRAVHQRIRRQVPENGSDDRTFRNGNPLARSGTSSVLPRRQTRHEASPRHRCPRHATSLSLAAE